MTDGLRDQLQRTLSESYTIESELGGGGMSRVFVATERALGRQVVVKVLPGEMSGQLAIDRFRREIAVAAQLQHPHIVPLLTAGETGGVPYFTMPFVKGESLRHRLGAGAPIPLTDAVRMLREIASALAFAHQHGVVHRDIKPENVLLSGGSAMVTDFGVAKALSASTMGDGGLTSVGVALGTPAYMSPEQATADPLVDHRTDVYAWGVLAYELLTGSTPFGGRTAAAILAAQVIEPVESIIKRNGTIPPALGALVMRCLAKDPSERPQHADEIVATLDTINTPSQGTIAHTSAAPAARPKPRLMRWVISIGVLAVALIAWLTLHDRNAGAGTTNAKSVAVLPFENAGGDSTQEYLADGMTDDIASALVNAGVRVAARTSSNTYKGKHPTPQEVGSTLHVDVVLLSAVRRLGDRMHVTAELVNARDALPIWSYVADTNAADIFAVQHAITDSIVGALKIKLVSSASRPAVARNEDPALHEMVMRARYLANLATPAAVRRGIDLFRQVIAKDSLNTDARVGLAFALAELADGYLPPSEVMPEAIAQVAKALTIDSLNPRALAMRAALSSQYAYDWPRTRREIDIARPVNPNDPTVDLAEMIYWTSQGRADRVVAPARHGIGTDPLSPLASMMLGWAFYLTGQNDSVVVQATHLDSLYPGFAYVDDFKAYSLTALKRYDEAERDFRVAEKALGHRSPGLAWLLAQRGRAPEARAILAEIERDWKEKYVVPELVAMAWLALGDKDKMYSWLNKGFDVHSALATYLRLWPPFDSIRKEPRYQALLRRLAGKQP